MKNLKHTALVIGVNLLVSPVLLLGIVFGFVSGVFEIGYEIGEAFLQDLGRYVSSLEN